MGKKRRGIQRNSVAGGSSKNEIVPVFFKPQATLNMPSSTKTGFLNGAFAEWLGLFALSVAAFFTLTARLAGVKVSVLSDEYSYVLDTNFRDPGEAYYPNHLFQLIYSVTKICGPDFYECARNLNSVFITLSGLVVYLLGKHISGKTSFGLIGWAVTILGSFGTYAAYFMPEAIFNFFMVVFFLLTMLLRQSPNLLAFFLIGLSLGLASTAKPHALLLVPAVMIFLALSAWTLSRSWRFGFASITLFLGGVLIGDLGIGLLIAGSNGLSLFGSYGGVGDIVVSAVSDTVSRDFLAIPTTALGQALVVTMVIGVALPVAIYGLYDFVARRDSRPVGNSFRAFFALSILNMTAVSAAFESWYTGDAWMHTRYYSYLIPLSTLVLIEAWSDTSKNVKNKMRLAITGLFLVAALYSLFTTAAPYGGNWIDAPDFKAHIDNPVISSLLIFASIVAVIWWNFKSRVPLLIGVILSLIASIFAGVHTSNFLVQKFGAADGYERIGRILRDFLPPEELDRSLLFGHEGWLMQRTLFYSLSGGADAFFGEEKDLQDAIEERSSRWLVKFGEPLSQSDGHKIISGSGFYLYSLSPSNTLAPQKSQITSFTGTCLDSEKVNWLCENSSSVTLDSSLPPNAKVDIFFEVGDGVEGELRFVVGESSFTYPVKPGLYVVPLSFTNPLAGKSLLITFDVTSGIGGNNELIRLISANMAN